MSKTKWHSGPPPSVGWWPASMCGNYACFRWWDGSRWSAAAWAEDTKDQASFAAGVKTYYTYIKWTDRPASWPERSRT